MGPQTARPGNDRTPPGEVLEALGDLKHDLGKYLYLPLGMLPRDAAPDRVLQAGRNALFHTRQSDRGSRSAAQIWRAFTQAWQPQLLRFGAFDRVVSAVDRALAWGPELRREVAAVDRSALERDLKAVGAAIRALIQEVQLEE